MTSSDLLAAARRAEARLDAEADQLIASEVASIAYAKAEHATLPANYWQGRWQAEQKARAARLLRTALEEALA
jgi:hypothetical protein